MTETGTSPADQTVLRPSPTAEPATPRARWPTFLRRTLEEEALRPVRHATPGQEPSDG